jgi:hypothetical protein
MLPVAYYDNTFLLKTFRLFEVPEFNILGVYQKKAMKRNYTDKIIPTL